MQQGRIHMAWVRSHTKKQERMSHNDEKNHSTETDPKWTKLLKLTSTLKQVLQPRSNAQKVKRDIKDTNQTSTCEKNTVYKNEK